MNQPTPEQALQFLAKATEPGVKMTRLNYVEAEAALVVLDGALKRLAKLEEDAAKKPANPTP